MFKPKHSPLALIILDGWGYRENPHFNAIALAKKPTWDYLWKHYPHTLISGSGRCVGLPEGQMGNSEVGHLTMGAGRLVQQDLTRIDDAIQNGQFFSHPLLLETFKRARETNKAVHILGLLSPGGVHSEEKQIHALIKYAAQQRVQQVYIHAFLDGRDTPPRSAEASLRALMEHCQQVQCGKIASLIGRYYAMDRDNRWERVAKAYQLIVQGKADYEAPTPLAGLQAAYDRGENDEFIKSTCIHSPSEPAITMKEGDTVIFMNFRADRARELTRALIETNFQGFAREVWPKLHLLTLTQYDATFKVPVIFTPTQLNNNLGEYISQLGLRQLRIAETEKYAHVTFFFNGGIEQPYPGEERILIPSPKVATYDLKPEMSAHELADRLVAEIKRQAHEVIICNFANPDMVGHTGNLPATIKAIETIDQCLGKIIAALKEVGGEALITADHGNAEMLFDETTQQPHTAHTIELVPLLYVGRLANILKNGKLSDIAPTLLYLLDIDQPPEMTGKPLLEIGNS